MLRDLRTQFLLGAIVALSALVWAALWAGTLGQVPLCGGGTAPRLASAWDLGRARGLVLTWVTMSIAMMLPSAIPQVSCARHGVTIGSVLALVRQHLVVPVGVGTAAAFAEWALQSSGLLADLWLRVGLIVVSGLLASSAMLRAHHDDNVAICSAMACLQLGAGMNPAAMAMLSVGLLAFGALHHPMARPAP